MTEICGTDYYETGVFTPGTAMLQPALYARELANGLAKQGVEIFENSRVAKMERADDAWSITTDKGILSANTVILATNGHAESFGFFKRRLIHIYLFASMTRALTGEEEEATRWPCELGLHPFRPTWFYCSQNFRQLAEHGF